MDYVREVSVVFAALSAFASFLLLCLFFCVRELRKWPGNLVLLQFLCQFLLDIHWFTLYVKEKTTDEGKPTTACVVLGAVGLMAYVAAYNYAVAVGAAIASGRFNPSCGTQAWYHGMCWVLATAVAAGAAAIGDTGESVMGTCFITKGTNAECGLCRVAMALIIMVHTSLSVVLCAYALCSRANVQVFVVVTLLFTAMWIPSAAVHFLAWKHWDLQPMDWLTGVKSIQTALIAGSLSGVATVVTRVVFLKRLNRRRGLPSQNQTLMP